MDTKKNLIAQSQSGTGKTLCFGVAMLSAVDPSKNVPQAICLCPSLELGQQNYNFIKEISQYTKVNVEGYLKGDMSEDKITAQVIIGTPGKIVGLIKGKKLMTNDIKLFVLDEADQMIDQTQGELRVQVDFVKKMIPKQSRVMLFSATYQETLEGTDHGSKKDQKIMEYAEKFVPEEKEKILIPRTELALTAIRQYAVICQDDKDKFNVLSTIFRELPIAQAMIFLHTKVGAQELAKQLRDKGFTISLLHSDISSEERKDIIKAFEKGDTKLLISTNVLARGIDVKQVTHVINYDPPYTKDNGPDPDLYLHRIGRTGRFGRQGYAINLCSEKDRNIYDYIAKYFKKDMTWLKSSDDLEYTIK